MKIAKERSYSSINIGDVEEFQRRVTIEDIDKFTELSGDNNPLHNDEDYAKYSSIFHLNFFGFSLCNMGKSIKKNLIM